MVADSGEKLSWPVREFGSACEKMNFRVNVGMMKVMRCSLYVNVVEWMWDWMANREKIIVLVK